jgi:hypothetical protein
VVKYTVNICKPDAGLGVDHNRLNRGRSRLLYRDLCRNRNRGRWLHKSRSRDRFFNYSYRSRSRSRSSSFQNRDR